MGVSTDWTVLYTLGLLHRAQLQPDTAPRARQVLERGQAADGHTGLSCTAPAGSCFADTAPRERHRSWNEDERLKFLLAELTGRRPLLPPAMETSAEVKDVLDTFKVIGQLPPDSLGAYVISMAHTASDVLAVVLLQARRPAGQRHIYGWSEYCLK